MPGFCGPKTATGGSSSSPERWSRCRQIPEPRIVEIHRTGHAPDILDEKGILRAEDILPGFEFPVKALFKD